MGTNKTFIDTFLIASADGQVVTEEMKLLVAAEAPFIVNRPMADYRRLRRINLWKTKIQGVESAKDGES